MFIRRAEISPTSSSLDVSCVACVLYPLVYASRQARVQLPARKEEKSDLNPEGDEEWGKGTRCLLSRENWGQRGAWCWRSQHAEEAAVVIREGARAGEG